MESRLLEKYPASLPDFYRHLGNRYVKSGKIEKGFAILEKNYEIYPKSRKALSNLGDTYLEIKVRAEARGWYLNQLRQASQK